MKYKLAIAFSCLLALVASSCVQGTVLTTGASAPVFELFDTTGKVVSLSSYPGRPVMLNFWGTN